MKQAHWLAARRIAPDAAGQLLALPVTLPGKLVAAIWRFVVGFLVLGPVLNLSAHALTPGYQTLPVPVLVEVPLILLPVAALYYAACIAGARASKALIETWSPPPAPVVAAYRTLTEPSRRERMRDYLFWA